MQKQWEICLVTKEGSGIPKTYHNDNKLNWHQNPNSIAKEESSYSIYLLPSIVAPLKKTILSLVHCNTIKPKVIS